jgi:D-alanine-D-alanine ligase-like ATP-grasp enzyme
MRTAALVGTALLAASGLWAQGQPQTPAQAAAARARLELFRAKRVPHEAGFRVFIVPDMEGMGSAVDIHEVIAGNEGEHYKTLTSPDYWDRFRLLLTM